MPEADPALPFYLIVTDHDRGFFAVEVISRTTSTSSGIECRPAATFQHR
jgi:hypothetical protein